jgi:hypothetical protein
LVEAGDSFNVAVEFVEATDSNVVSFVFKYDGSKFASSFFQPAKGVQLLEWENGEGYISLTLMIQNYNAKVLGSITVNALTDANFGKAYQVIYADAEYVVKDKAGGKEILAAKGMVRFTTFGQGSNVEPVLPGDTNGDGKLDLIDLSNMIDWFGYNTDHTDWHKVYAFFDFGGEKGAIDIYDIVYIARLIKAA